MRIAIAQINLTVGNIQANIEKIEANIRKADNQDADLIVFPELSVTGYPPEDLLLKPKFVSDNIAAFKKVASLNVKTASVIGFADAVKKELYNSVGVVENRRIKTIYHKMFLPNYGVFDENRYFSSGTEAAVIEICGVKIGLNICEDIWNDRNSVKEQVRKGAKIIIVSNASPYHMGRIKEREKVVLKHAKENGVYIVYANLVGGQDELVFDGYSMVAGPEGKIIARADAFKEDFLVVDIPIGRGSQKIDNRKANLLNYEDEIYSALSLGLKDYMAKNHFKEAVIGLSGGVDSSLVAAIAVNAIGKDRVHGVFMPSRFTSRESKEDAFKLAANLGIEISSIPIEGTVGSYAKALKKNFRGVKKDITEENLQARIRGNILMALSNKFGWLVLTTGNKSEMSTGYSTLYGDMAGGFAVIKDVYKTIVYSLVKNINKTKAVIPRRVITKEPTAELRLDQKDSDTLPPYPVLDEILKLYIEHDFEAEKIVSLKYDKETVNKVIALVDKSEYKRRQGPTGIKITPKAFGRDRRMPITNGYKG